MPRGYVLGSYLDSANNVISHMNISSVRVQHGGLYTCVARNVLGAVQHSAMLNIYGKLPQYRKVSTETSDNMIYCISVTWILMLQLFTFSGRK